MKLYEVIYNHANRVRIAETQAAATGKEIIAAYTTSRQDVAPNDIHKLGKNFNKYNELYTDYNGNNIPQEQFVIELYNELSATEDLTEKQVFDGIFYYLLPADKKFLIPYNYQNIRYKLKRDDKPDLEKVYTLSRHFALELFLKDLIGAYNSDYSLLIKSNFDKKILYIIKNNIILDLSNENDVNILKALRKHY